MFLKQPTPWEVGNFVPRTLTARKNLQLEVSQEQAEILIGCILGDAYITKRGQIVIEQSSKQKEYLDWKFAKLKSLAYPGVSKVERFDKRYDKTYISYTFVLRQYFRPWREIFYNKVEGRKIFPQNLPLTPLSVAAWYMDDGCYGGRQCVLSLDGFDKNSRNSIQQTLCEVYGIETILRASGRLLIRKKSEEHFFSIIRPFIIPCMAYKIS